MGWKSVVVGGVTFVIIGGVAIGVACLALGPAAVIAALQAAGVGIMSLIGLIFGICALAASGPVDTRPTPQPMATVPSTQNTPSWCDLSTTQVALRKAFS